MKHVFILLLILGKLMAISAQIAPEEGCSWTTIQVAASSEENLTVRHAGHFIFLPSQGQETLWQISTTAHEGTIASSTDEHFIFDLTEHGITIADSIVVDLTITNMNGDFCSLRDTMVWTLVSVVNVNPPIELFDWYNLDSLGNPGLYNQEIVSSTSLLESEISVYPNPTNGLVHIDLGSSTITPDFITVYDAQGRLIERVSSTQVHYGSTDLYLNEAGLYILQIHFDHKVITQKVIVE